MENNPGSSIFDFNLDEESRSHLAAIAQWTNINAIAGLASAAITITFFIITLIRLSNYGGNLFSGLIVVWPFISLVVSLALNITLLNASSNIKKGIESSSQAHFETGITKLATYFKIVGIITIIAIVFVAFLMLVGILSSRGTGF